MNIRSRRLSALFAIVTAASIGLVPTAAATPAATATAAPAAAPAATAAPAAPAARLSAVPAPPPTPVTLAPGGLPADRQQPNGYRFTAGGEALATAASQPVAPGLTLTNFQREESGGWNKGNVLTADLSVPTLSMDIRNTGKVAGVAELSQQLAGTRAVAGINGDFFDINSSGAPVGLAAGSNGLVNSPSGSRPAFSLAGGRAAIGAMTTSGSITIAGQQHPIAGFNTPAIGVNGIGVYTPLWGDYTLDRPMGGPDNLSPKIARASIVKGVVTAVKSGAGAPDIPAGGQVVVGRESGADLIGSLKVGDRVGVTVGLSKKVDLALSGQDQLVIDGQVNPAVTDDGLHSRTAIGVSRDGSRVIAVTLDGQTTASHGMTRAELAGFMKSLGAYQALNLDGGGSSMMAARVSGSTAPLIVNTPSDGHERQVSNSLLFYSSAKHPGTAVDAQIRPMTNRAGAYTVLAGQTRTLFGSGLDGDFAAVQQRGSFRASGSQVRLDRRPGDRSGRDTDSVVATGRRPGTATIGFDLGGHRRAELPLTVLGTLDHFDADRTVIPFSTPGTAPAVAPAAVGAPGAPGATGVADSGQGATVQLTGYDADGRPSPLEPADVRVTADPGVTVAPDGVNGFRIVPTIAKGSAVVHFSVGRHTFDTTVLVGLDQQMLADFQDGASWRAETARATGTVTPTTGPTGQAGLRLQYDFTQSTATRGMYAVPPAGIAVTGQPLNLTLQVKGDGTGVWPRIQITSGNGTVSNLDGPFVTWTGWQQITFPIPTGTVMPIRVDKIRFLEILPDRTYRGDVSIADLVANVPPPAAPTTIEPVRDPVIVTDGTVDDRPQRIAVLSDGQFVARDPNSPLVANVRKALREIVAAKPDRLIIDGDFVDEASPADIAFAKMVLDEEVGTAVPWTYVPGNHEVMGGPIDNFKAVFGATHTSTLLSSPRGGATRIITLNSSALNLHGNDDGIAQLTELEQQLQAAAKDNRVTGVLVAAHVPVDDPLSDKASQLGDRIEARQLADRLGRFRTESGKSVAVINGHVGVFHAAAEQGVSMIINGNSGKTPAGNVTDGGFRGWTMLGIDPRHGVVGFTPAAPADRLDWLQAETHPSADAVQLTAPASLSVGSTTTLTPTFTQGTRAVPISWPVSAQWTLDGQPVDRAHSAVRFDPTSHRLTAVRPGTAELTVVVNGVKASAKIHVHR